MEEDAILEMTHAARIVLAREYMDGKRDDQALNGAMIRLLLRSLETELAQRLSQSR